jgi:D-glycero-beta-D-manno-heptose 1-phosphate adenylyltransferase
MKTTDRDPQSYYAIVESFLRQADLPEEQYQLLTKELKRYLKLKLERGSYVHPVITKFCTDWYREFYRLIENTDPYKRLKDLSNEEARKILSTLPCSDIYDAIDIAIKGNKLDFGAVLVLNPDISKLHEEFLAGKANLTIDDTQELLVALEKAQSVLFLADNAGEILFDTPLLQELGKKVHKSKLYIAAKQTPMLNDVTFDELKELGIGEYGTLVSTGSNCFGLHEEDVSKECMRILKDADVIVAKGQAYLEFFTEYNFQNVFHLTRVKYPVINDALGELEPHQNVVIASRRYAHTGKSYGYENLHPKIVDRSKLRELVEALRREGKKIVTANGSYDVLHYGHIRTLQEAKQQGDVLIVGLNSDSSIKQYKSALRPINTQDHRAELMVALDCVDYVFVFDDTVPMPFLEDVKPDVHCNGVEYGEECIEAETVKKYGGRIHLTGRYFSTTQMIEKMMHAYEQEKKNDGESMQEEIMTEIKNRNGVLFALPAVVQRSTYKGRNILAQNSSYNDDADERGYLPVERWIMSMTQAENEIMVQGEGITQLQIGKKPISLHQAAEIAEHALFGEYRNKWALTKILDIGGDSVVPSFSSQPEVPPIPVHVHAGQVKDGKIEPPGKLEAYFFPPVTQEFGAVVTRLGLRSDVSKEEVVTALAKFGQDDSLYGICNIFPVHPYDGWIIPPGVVHAPGPWLTFEIQVPQDDFNLLSWQFGERADEEKKNELQLRGLRDEQDVFEQTIDWEMSTHPEFRQKFYRPSKILEQGRWGRRLQIFFDTFYGESIEVHPGQTFSRNPDERPFAGLVWSGNGRVNGNAVEKFKEFLVTPHTLLEIENTGNEVLMVFTVFPLNTNNQHNTS